MLESAYQLEVIKRLKAEFPGCVVIINDPRRTQGIPDLLILFGPNWAMLEVKAAYNSPSRANQSHYVEDYGRMSYCAFIFPENEEEIFNELQFALCNRR
jgi:hypothetical protein